MKYLLTLLLLMGSALGGEPPEAIREKGFAALKAAQENPDRIVEAAKLLAEASDAFLAIGNDKEAQETESYLFWAKKKMTIQQIDAFLAKDGAVAQKVVEKLAAVEKREVKSEEAAAYMSKADAYASSSKDGFLTAVRYFEVASRFKGTPEAEKAMEKSLAAFQTAKVAPAVKQVPTTKGKTHELFGKWRVQYDNGHWREIAIDASGLASVTNSSWGFVGMRFALQLDPATRSWVSVNNDKNTVEVYSLSSGSIIVNRYEGRRDYPAKVMNRGTGTTLSVP